MILWIPVAKLWKLDFLKDVSVHVILVIGKAFLCEESFLYPALTIFDEIQQNLSWQEGY